MACSSKTAESSLLLPRQRFRPVAAEEYVLDERVLGGPRAAPVLPRVPTHHHHPVPQVVKRQQQQRRSAAELRTVSIIDTLSELVQAGGPRGPHQHHQHYLPGDCDGQCRPPPPPPPTQAGSTLHPSLAVKTRNQKSTACEASGGTAPPSYAARAGGRVGRPGRDSNHFMLSTLQSKGRTPDWIAGIFSIARRGNLQRLSLALTDMDATLIRNLSDHRGNNLFHVCCCYGHLDCLQWLLQRGRQCEDAVLDENKYELTPLVCAVKYGKLPCVEWLIGNSKARGQLTPNNGGRPLLHWAAKYGQEVILKWLAAYMENNGMDVNVRDGYGNTSLHMAAKHGHAVSVKALVTHCCDVSLRNDLGHKASDYAALYSQTACSEYLLSLEACLLLSSDVASLDTDLNCAKSEMAEMKTQFKDVMSCSKKLVKEREELSHHLARLQDGIVNLNSVIITELQSLYHENKSLREKSSDFDIRHENNSHLEETIALCHAMHTRWQEGQQRWLSPSALSDIQKKLILAEERWKRAHARVNWGEKEPKQHMTVFRERMAQVQCRSSGIRLSDIRSISSSESSLASMEDQMTEYESHYGDYELHPPATELPPPSQLQHNCSCHGQCSAQPPSAAALAQPCVASHQDCKSHVLPTSIGRTAHIFKLPTTGPTPAPKRIGNVGSTAGTGPEVMLGGCKVLEVIVGSDVESVDGADAVKTSAPKSPVIIKKSAVANRRDKECREAVPRGGRRGGRNDDDEEEETGGAGRGGASERQQQSGGHRSGRVTEFGGDFEQRREKQRTNSSETRDAAEESDDNEQICDDSCGRVDGQLTFSEPDLIIGTKGIRNSSADPEPPPPPIVEASFHHFGRIPSSSGHNHHHHEETEDGDELSTAEEDRCEDESFSTSRDELDCISMGAGEPLLGSKRRNGGGSFLRKLNRVMWPTSRRRVAKSSSTKKVKEITPGDFRDTYMHVRNGTGEEGQVDAGNELAEDEFVVAPVAVRRASAAVAVFRSTATIASSAGEEVNCGGESEPRQVQKPKRSKSAVMAGSDDKAGHKSGSVEAASTSRDLLFLELGGTADVAPSCTTVRDVPIPPVPSSPVEMAPPEENGIGSKGEIADTERRDFNVTSFERQEQEEEEDDRFLGEGKEDNCRPEADQQDREGVGKDDSLDPATCVHARAGLPPQRPSSRGSKSDLSGFSMSRPESSASRTESCTGGGLYQRLSHFSLRKASSSVSASDLLVAVAGSDAPSRASPAPSEVSKTESALSPPSEAPSKTESLRHHLRQLGRIEEAVQLREAPPPPVLAVLAMRRLTAEVRQATMTDADVIDGTKQLQSPGLVTGCPASSAGGPGGGGSRRNSKDDVGDGSQSSYLLLKVGSDSEAKPNVPAAVKNICKDAKPWYELSDDDEVLMPETLNRGLAQVKNISEDEEVFYCA